MGKISNLCKFRMDAANQAQLNSRYIINTAVSDSAFCRYMSRSEFLFLFIRYLLTLMVIVLFVTILFPDLIDDIISLSLRSFFRYFHWSYYCLARIV